MVSDLAQQRRVEPKERERSQPQQQVEDVSHVGLHNDVTRKIAPTVVRKPDGWTPFGVRGP